jgi:hypothetical protein
MSSAEGAVPIDPHAFDDGDLDHSDSGSSSRRFREFECPVCNANNPCDDDFGDGDEVRCFYCGQEFKAGLTTAGRLRLREI